MNVILQPETQKAMSKIPVGVMDHQSMALGFRNGEPILFIFDAMLRYAKAYEQRFESKLCDDGVLGGAWFEAIVNVHTLLNGDGAVALEMGISTDSKSNSVCEEVYWAARNAAGFVDETAPAYQPKTGAKCSCRPGQQRDNCTRCEGTGMVIDFVAIRARKN